MNERSNKPITVGVLARSLLTRLEESARVLSSDVEFECADCQDTGLVAIGKRYEKCRKCSDVELKPKGIFF